jgi:hypothetical protein
MPGLSGVLTLQGDLKKSYDCNQDAIQYASTTHVPDASGEVLAAAQQLSQSGLEILSRKASKSSIQSTDDVALQTIQLQEGDSSKTLEGLSTRRLVVSFFVSLIVIQDIIRLRSRRRTKSRQRSSPRTGHMPTKLCPSG